MRVRTIVWGLFKAAILATALLLTAAGSAWVTIQMAFAGRETRVPDLTGLGEKEAGDALAREGLRLRVTGRKHSDSVEAERVFEQEPAPGAKTKRNRTVRATISLGLRTHEVPRCTGQALDRALDRIRTAGLKEGQVLYVHSVAAPAGTVLAQEPEPGIRSLRSDRVHFVVSSGPRRHMFVMPDLQRRGYAEAREALERYGLGVGAPERRYVEGMPGGIVAAQFPAPGSRVGDGQNVTLVVSEGLEGGEGRGGF